jgi:dGTPase
MSSIRSELEARERSALAPYAALSVETRGRLRPEVEDPIRTAFQRDRDRVVHSKAFRRLKHKTQVFLAPTGDHYRTRLTHTLEMSQVARTIARVLCLNEDLTEAIALGHDLGHTPFGHAGEQVLKTLMPGGFNHYEQSLRVVDVLERNRQGLNLTWEVRNGIAKHSKGKDGAPIGLEPARRAATLEGQVVRVADMIAYVNHDIDDAVRAGVLAAEALPAEPLEVLGTSSSTRIGTLVSDVVQATMTGEPPVTLRMSQSVLDALLALRAFLFDAVYENEAATSEFRKVAGILGGLWERASQEPVRFLDQRTIEQDGLDIAIRDFIAGMTDRFAVNLYQRLFVPRAWSGPISND